MTTTTNAETTNMMELKEGAFVVETFYKGHSIRLVVIPTAGNKAKPKDAYYIRRPNGNNVIDKSNARYGAAKVFTMAEALDHIDNHNYELEDALAKLAPHEQKALYEHFTGTVLADGEKVKL